MTKQPEGWVIDPPEGWRYGFPRLFNPEEGETDEEWFLRMGYPQEEIDRGMLKYCRKWRATMAELDKS